MGKLFLPLLIISLLTPVTIGAYEKLPETVGADSTLTIFGEQVKAVRKKSKSRSK